jgi:superfamily II DNA helicase RecQ
VIMPTGGGKSLFAHFPAITITSLFIISCANIRQPR